MNELEEILGIKFPEGTIISGVTNSTKKIKKDYIFFGLPGTKKHGSKYIDRALELGASIIVHNDPKYHSKEENIFFIQDLYEFHPIINPIFDLYDENTGSKHFRFLEKFYDIYNINQIGSDIKFHGFTGTNGKTTSANLCHQIFSHLGFNTLYIGTLGVQFNNNDINKSLISKTTPDIFELFEILNFYNFKEGEICIELSSHALDQDRLHGVRLEYAAIMNIEEDHLDYHGNLQDYANSKFKILGMLRPDNFWIDPDSKLLIKYLNKFFIDNDYSEPKKEIEKHSLAFENLYKDDKKTFFHLDISNPVTTKIMDGYRVSNRLGARNTSHKFLTTLFPYFNIKNLMFALIPIMLKDTKSRLNDGLNDLSYLRLPKGRIDLIEGIAKNIIIDYAHNLDAFETVLSSIKENYDNLIIVFGCGGDRDKLKRSKMMRSALKHCKNIIFTSDNSRSESFQDIFKDAASGNDVDDVIVINDRKEAIIHGSKLIGDNDCLLILGKGHEETQETDGNIEHFSDYEVVHEIYS